MPTESGPAVLIASMIFWASSVVASSQVMFCQLPLASRLIGYLARLPTRKSSSARILCSYRPLTQTRPALVGCAALPRTATALPAALTPISRPQPTEQ